jgi:hypothetical protein
MAEPEPRKRFVKDLSSQNNKLEACIKESFRKQASMQSAEATAWLAIRIEIYPRDRST